MVKNGNRTLEVSKIELMATITENRKQHLIDYEKALDAYKIEALRQLQELTISAQNGECGLTLKLIEPVNNVKHYDDAITMFGWELENKVTLTQAEFRDYVLDEAPDMVHAKFQNATYFSR